MTTAEQEYGLQDAVRHKLPWKPPRHRMSEADEGHLDRMTYLAQQERDHDRTR